MSETQIVDGSVPSKSAVAEVAAEDDAIDPRRLGVTAVDAAPNAPAAGEAAPIGTFHAFR